MKKVKLSFENCYGIKKLTADLDFSFKNVVVIYAPNGVMKTSFLKTMADVENPKEEIYKRPSVCSIKDEEGNIIGQENIFTVGSLNENYVVKNESMLLVNKELRKEYDDIYSDIEDKKNEILKQIKVLAGFTTRDIKVIENQMLLDFPCYKSFFEFVVDIVPKIENQPDDALSDIEYTKVFNQYTEGLLRENDFMAALDSYMKVYNNLLEQSNLFKPGFDYYNANIVTKTLNEGGWFKAGHKVKVLGNEREIGTKEQLEEILNTEKERFINNDALKESFKVIDSTLTTKGARELRTYLNEHKELLPELANIELLKQKLWLSYMAKIVNEFVNLRNLYNNSQERLKLIITEAEKETQKWQNVLSIFNNRFSVPFSISITNEAEAVLGLSTPQRKLTFNDGAGEVTISNDTLKQILSQGEKRAKYLLDIIFDLETLKKSEGEKLLVFDDIADSFDYRNKYAIIEYLKDISEVNDKFRLIILTHNFDFYRSVTSRLGVPRPNRLLAEKNNDEIILLEEKYQRHSPVLEWRKCQSIKAPIALIPFVRNLVEFCHDEDDPDFELLTCLLHQKEQTPSISIEQLHKVFKKYIKISNENGLMAFKDTKVETKIYELANVIINEPQRERMELEDKIILSIAIRLKVEKFMIEKIADDDFVSGIKSNQTQKLSAKFKKMFENDTEVFAIIDKVNLMTPENIHINSFMYEPILDMSNDYLRNLYKDVLGLFKV